METAYIDPDIAEELYDSDNGETVQGWARIEDRHDGSGRWMEDRTLIIADPAGQTWGLHYQVGLTESQHREFPWHSATEPLALERLYRHAVVTSVYRTAPPDDAAGRRMEAATVTASHGLDPGQVC